MDVDETIHVRLPRKLAWRLRARVPSGDRDAWTVAAIQQRLRSEGEAIGHASRLEAIERSFGTWTEEDFPGLDTVEDIKRWRASLWAGRALRGSRQRRRPGTQGT